MGAKWRERRVHSGIGEIAGGKPMVFRNCLDCGCRVYHNNAKRCNACALAVNTARARVLGNSSYQRRLVRQRTGYADMLRLLGIREVDGDCT